MTATIDKTKKVHQIIAYLGDGKLKDGDSTFRKYLETVDNDTLIKYAEQCIEKSFEDSGLALQDVVNEIGRRLSYEVKNGLYRGNRNDIGYDGIWRQQDEWALVIEVKTTDAYRISLDVISEYRKRLIENGEIEDLKSSILIVVGRNDTGELEAQIRGSKHAWDIRIISIDSLIRLLKIKESLSDLATSKKISIALRPYEFTRIDRLVELLFLAIKDIEDDYNETEECEVNKENTTTKECATTERTEPVKFHLPVLAKIQKITNKNYIKQTKTSYVSSDKQTGIVISVSKKHEPANSQYESRYWFAFHSYQEKYLDGFNEAFVCFGCGSDEIVFMIPLAYLKTIEDLMWRTKNEEKGSEYKHIVIFGKGNKFYLRTNIEKQENYEDITKYRI